MLIQSILIGLIFCFLIGWLRQWRMPLLFILSLVGSFLLQQQSPIEGLDIALPLLSLLLVLLTWAIIRPAEDDSQWQTYAALFVLTFVVGFSLTTPPELQTFLPIFVLGAGVAGGLMRLADNLAYRKYIARRLIFGIALLILLLKLPPVVRFLSELLRVATGLPTLEANVSDIQWIGVSYIALRLIAMLIDFREDRLLPMRFDEMLIYVLLPMSLLAGPIDRAQRFVPDLRAANKLDAERAVRGGQRLVVGMLKKFVIADSLALVALSGSIAPDTDGIVGAWLVAYVYAFQIFFDFSGYTDMVIGLGILAGIDLPENFNQPYLRQNLAAFWQNWHMTLTGWFRAYFFLPVSRWMLRRKLSKRWHVSEYFIAQLATMTLIGLWHGATGNFLLWGAWHAVGLYAHKLLADNTRDWYFRMKERPWPRRLIYISGVLATFHYVVIGWVFFALPNPSMSFDYLGKMFGL